MSLDTPLPTASATDAAVRLKEACGDLVHLPGDPSFDGVRTPWNVSIDLRPAAVAVPTSAEQVAQVVHHAARLGLRVAPLSTGHGAASLGGQEIGDVVLVRLGEMRGVTIDAERRIARVEGGAWWQDVVEAAAAHGLVALHGSSPDVGVAGYSLGGGIGWYARKHGLAANSITAVEIVTADGSIVRADAAQQRDLFWAVRGGGGNFGVVTALELRLFPVTDAYAGMMIWPLEQAEPVVRHWAAWSATAPDEVTTSLRAMRFPPMPELPDFLRGRQVLVVDGVVLGDDEFGAEQVAGLRALSPEMDTFGRVPAAALARLHMDPEGPTPSAGGSTMVADLDEDAVTAFLEAVGPGASTSLLFGELRQLGGALGRDAEEAGALPRLDGSHVAFFLGIAATPEMAAQAKADAERAIRVLKPWSSGSSFLNLVEEPTDTSTAYDPEAWKRLRELRATVDPDGVFVAGHRITTSHPQQGERA